MKKSARLVALALAAPAALALVVASASSCNQSPTNVAVRSFQQAQRSDVVCMHVNDANGNSIAAQPLTQDSCYNIPNTTDAGNPLPNHLYSVVTQLTRGELAVVDLTGQFVVDEDKSTPGINFIPVGPEPTDVKTEPDGLFTFVSSGDPSKPAIYAIDNHLLLGNSQGTGVTADGGAQSPLQLTDLSACALPQPAQGLVVAPRSNGAAGGADGGGAGGFVLVALLREFAGIAPKVAAIDIPTLLAGPKGSLPACRVLGYTNLSGSTPSSWTPGPAWPDGVPYVDGGVDTGGDTPPLAPTCSAGSGGSTSGGAGGTDGGLPLAATTGSQPVPLYMALRDDLPIVYVADSGLPLIHVVDLGDPTAPKELEPLLATSVVNPQRSVTVGQLAVSPVTRDFKRYLYAVDQEQGSLLVYDVTDPVNSPHTPMERPHAELNPFQDPDRIGFTAPVATLAFVQHDWPLPDQANATNPINQYTGLLCNPNPNAHPDAGLFLDNGAFYRVDEAALIQTNGTADFFPNRLRGVFGFVTLSNGNIVAIDVDDWDAPCRRPDPMATSAVPDLGQVTYDPVNSAPPPSGDAGGLRSLFGQTGSLAVPEPTAGTGDLDPYHAPITYNSLISGNAAVTEEAFFPVSAPNRLRSSQLLLNDPLSGNHVPNVASAPQLFNVNNSSVPGGTASPIILPTALPEGWYDPNQVLVPSQPDPSQRTALTQSAPVGPHENDFLIPGPASTTNPNPLGPSVRVSLDDPTAQQGQNWTVTYEGRLPSVSGVLGTLSSSDGYETMTLMAPNARLCESGIEDWQIGQERARQVLAALDAAMLPRVNVPTQNVTGNPALPGDISLLNWTGDYIQITDDLLPNTDPYWKAPVLTDGGQPNNACWDGDLANDKDPNVAQARYNRCDAVFGTSSDTGFIVDKVFARDLPILDAFDDHLVLGRFYSPATDRSGAPVPAQNTNRIIVGPDPGNAATLRLAQCCFHSQAGFAVRTGGEWVASGSTVGLIHHVQTDPSTGACVLSCDPRLALANARSFDIPWSSSDQGCMAKSTVQAPGRDSVLAMRNPMFSYVTWAGCGAPASSVDHTTTVRDDSWRFSVTGSFSPLTVSLTEGTNVPVSPQSMLFIPSLQQLAVVDGQLQGLVLIDLNTLAFAHAPYF